jgi:broad specificity phosphatase PhoE
MPGPTANRANLLLLRAGQTTLSAEGRFTGRLDPPLDAQGIEQARRAASALAAQGIVAVGTSPLRRARQTAEIVAEACAVPCDVLHDLIDVDVGSWAGFTTEDAARASPETFDVFFRFPASFPFPDGERMWGALERISDALASLHRSDGRSVVAVSHELPIRLVLMRLRRLEGTALWDPLVRPGSITSLRATSSGLAIASVLEDLFRAARCPDH